MKKIIKRFNEKSVLERAAYVLGTIVFLFYLSYFIKMLIWPETLKAVIIAVCVMLITSLPLVFMDKIKRLAGDKLYKALCSVYVFFGALYLASFSAMCIYIGVVNSSTVTAETVEDDTVFIVYGAGLVGEKPGKALQKRLDKTLELYAECSDAYIIVSGSKGENEIRPEADAMRDYLLEHGVKDERILREDKARDTKQNIKYSLEIIEENGLENREIVSVSNAFHIPRINILCEKYGVETRLAAAEDPDASNILASFVREYMSYIKLVFSGID